MDSYIYVVYAVYVVGLASRICSLREHSYNLTVVPPQNLSGKHKKSAGTAPLCRLVCPAIRLQKSAETGEHDDLPVLDHASERRSSANDPTDCRTPRWREDARGRRTVLSTPWSPGLSPEEKTAAQASCRDRRGVHRGDVLRGRDEAGPRRVPCGVGEKESAPGTIAH